MTTETVIKSNNIPPIYYECRKQFGVDWEKGIIITHGKTIYCKNPNIPPHLMVHEKVHVRQQIEMGVEAWWKRYFADEKFRLDQELEAYLAQAKYVRATIGNWRKRDEILDHIYKSLSGPMYGNLITYDKAVELLK